MSEENNCQINEKERKKSRRKKEDSFVIIKWLRRRKLLKNANEKVKIKVVWKDKRGKFGYKEKKKDIPVWITVTKKKAKKKKGNKKVRKIWQKEKIKINISK